MNNQIAIVRIDGQLYEYELTGEPGDYNWRCPSGELAEYAAGGATPTDARQNLEMNLIGDEPDFEGIYWA